MRMKSAVSLAMAAIMTLSATIADVPLLGASLTAFAASDAYVHTYDGTPIVMTTVNYDANSSAKLCNKNISIDVEGVTKGTTTVAEMMEMYSGITAENYIFEDISVEGITAEDTFAYVKMCTRESDSTNYFDNWYGSATTEMVFADCIPEDAGDEIVVDVIVEVGLNSGGTSKVEIGDPVIFNGSSSCIITYDGAPVTMMVTQGDSWLIARREIDIEMPNVTYGTTTMGELRQLYDGLGYAGFGIEPTSYGTGTFNTSDFNTSLYLSVGGNTYFSNEGYIDFDDISAEADESVVDTACVVVYLGGNALNRNGVKVGDVLTFNNSNVYYRDFGDMCFDMGCSINGDGILCMTSGLVWMSDEAMGIKYDTTTVGEFKEMYTDVIVGGLKINSSTQYDVTSNDFNYFVALATADNLYYNIPVNSTMYEALSDCPDTAVITGIYFEIALDTEVVERLGFVEGDSIVINPKSYLSIDFTDTPVSMTGTATDDGVEVSYRERIGSKYLGYEESGVQFGVTTVAELKNSFAGIYLEGYNLVGDSEISGLTPDMISTMFCIRTGTSADSEGNVETFYTDSLDFNEFAADDSAIIQDFYFEIKIAEEYCNALGFEVGDNIVINCTDRTFSCYYAGDPLEFVILGESDAPYSTCQLSFDIEGITYGTSTFADLREKYDYLTFGGLYFESFSVDGLTAEDFEVCLCVETATDSENSWYEHTYYGNVLNTTTEMGSSSEDDQIIRNISCKIHMNSDAIRENDLFNSVDVVYVNAEDYYTYTHDAAIVKIEEASENDTYFAGNIDIAIDGVTTGTTTVGELKELYDGVMFEGFEFSAGDVNGIKAEDLQINIAVQTNAETDNWYCAYDTDYFNFNAMLPDESDSCIVERVLYQIAVRDEAVTRLGLGTGDSFNVYHGFIALDNSNGGDILTSTDDVDMYFRNTYYCTVDGVENDVTTVEELKERYNGVVVYGTQFNGSDCEGLTADDISIKIILSTRNADATVYTDHYASYANYMLFSEIIGSEYDSEIVTGIKYEVLIDAETTARLGLTSGDVVNLYPAVPGAIGVSCSEENITLTVKSSEGETDSGLCCEVNCDELYNIVDYGVTTVGQLKKLYREIFITDFVFNGANLDGITADDIQTNVVIQTGTTADEFNGWYVAYDTQTIVLADSIPADADNDVVQNVIFQITLKDEAITRLGLEVGDTVIINPYDTTGYLEVQFEDKPFVVGGYYNIGMNVVDCDAQFTIDLGPGFVCGLNTVADLKALYSGIVINGYRFNSIDLEGATPDDVSLNIIVQTKSDWSGWHGAYDTNYFDFATIPADAHDEVVQRVFYQVGVDGDLVRELGIEVDDAFIVNPDDSGKGIYYYENPDEMPIIMQYDASGYYCGNSGIIISPEGYEAGVTTIGELKDLYLGINVDFDLISSTLSDIERNDIKADVVVQGTDYAWYGSFGSNTLNLSSIASSCDDVVINSIFYRLYINNPESFGIVDNDYIIINADERQVVPYVYQHDNDTSVKLTISEANDDAAVDLYVNASIDIPEMAGVTYQTTTVKELKALYSGVAVNGFKFKNATLNGSPCKITADDVMLKVALLIGDEWAWYDSTDSNFFSFDILDEEFDDYTVNKILYQICLNDEYVVSSGIKDGDKIVINPGDIVSGDADYYTYSHVDEPAVITIRRNDDGGYGAYAQYDLTLPNIGMRSTTIAELKELYTGIIIDGFEFKGSSVEGLTADDVMIDIIVFGGADVNTYDGWFGAYGYSTMTFDDFISSDKDSYIIHSIHYEVALKGEAIDRLGLNPGDTVIINPGDSTSMIYQRNDDPISITVRDSDGVTQSGYFCDVAFEIPVDGLNKGVTTVGELKELYDRIVVNGFQFKNANVDLTKSDVAVNVIVQSGEDWSGWHGTYGNSVLNLADLPESIDDHVVQCVLYQITVQETAVQRLGLKTGDVVKINRGTYTYNYDGMPLSFNVVNAQHSSSGLAASRFVQFDVPDIKRGVSTVADLKELYASLSVEDFEFRNSTRDNITEEDLVFAICVQTGADWSGWHAVYNTNTMSIDDAIPSEYDNDVIQAIGYEVSVVHENFDDLGLVVGDRFIVNTDDTWEAELSIDENGNLNFTPPAYMPVVGMNWYAISINGNHYTYFIGEYNGTPKISVPMALAYEHINGRDYSGDLDIAVQIVDLDSWSALATSCDSVVYSYDGCDVNSNIKSATNVYIDDNGWLKWTAQDDVVGYFIGLRNSDGIIVHDMCGNVTQWSDFCSTIKEYNDVGHYTICIYSIDKNGDISEPATLPYYNGELVAPANLAAVAGDGKITLTWDAVEGAGAYNVEIYNGTSWVFRATVEDTTYTDTGLTNGIAYTYRVVAYNQNGGKSEYSESVTATPFTVVTKPKVSVTAGVECATITWNEVPGATSYAVYSYYNGQYKLVGRVSTTSFTATGLVGGAEYGFLTRALIGETWTTFTEADLVYVTILASSKPKVSVTAGVESATITWNAVPGATKYGVFTYLDGTYTGIGTITETSITATGLTGGKEYGFLVRAYVNGAWTAFSEADLVYATILASSKPKVTVTAGVECATIRWNEVAGATSYAVYSYYNGQYKLVGRVTATSFTATGLVGGAEYGFLTRAMVDGTWTAFSEADLVYATILASSKPKVTVTAGVESATITWNAVPGATKYNVFTYLDGTYTGIGVTTGTTATATKLKGGVEYGFLVRAYVNGAWTAFSEADLVYATIFASSKPKVSVTAGVESATITWNEVAGATKYGIYTYLDGTYTGIGTITGTTITATGLTGGKEYGFLVRAYVNGAWTAFTEADLVYATILGVSKPKVSVTAGIESATITWNEVAGATSYAVYSYYNGQYKLVGRVTGTSFTATGLVGGEEYGFLTRALVDGAWTAFSEADLVYATILASSKPKVSVTAGVESATITWNEVAGATIYAVYSYYNGQYKLVGRVTETSFTATGLTGGKEYGFLTRALVDEVWTAFSEADLVYATILASSKPKASVTAGVESATITWNAVPGATNYGIYTYLDGSYKGIGTTAGTSITATNLIGGEEYGFLVRAYVNGKWTAFTEADLVYATILTSSKPKVSVTPGVKSAELAWGAVKGATKYAAYYYYNGNYIGIGITTDTSITANNLIGGAEYGFLVRAFVNGAWTTFSEADLVYETVLDSSKPDVTVFAGTGSAELIWNEVAGATKYAAYYYYNGNYIGIGITEATSITASNLISGAEYGFLVRAYVNGAWTAFSDADLRYKTIM